VKDVPKTKQVLVAGGTCGITMIAAARKIEDACWERKIRVNVNVLNLWESQYPGDGYDLIIEMFEFFENEKCPVISGRPFVAHQGEEELVDKIIDILSR
jgi:galactitol-specific phosphotransferase system IIB component